MKLLLLRTKYTDVSTRGVMLINDTYFGYTLEDYARNTKKIMHETAIPPGVYEIKVDYSPRFKRLMPRILNVPGFTGIRIHGGNTHKNTSGCPLVAVNKKDWMSSSTIWGSLGAKLTSKLRKSKDKKHWIEIINTQMPPE